MKTDECRISEPYAAFNPLRFDESKCSGCNICVNICRVDTMIPNPESLKPPLVVFPDECWFCGCCVEHCPEDALRLETPIAGMVAWKRKDTGEIFRRGMKNPPHPVVHTTIDGVEMNKKKPM